MQVLCRVIVCLCTAVSFLKKIKNVKTYSIPKISKASSLNGQLSLNHMKENWRSKYILLNSVFEAALQWTVCLKF